MNNRKIQKEKAFGTKSQPAPGPMRDKHMGVLKDFIQRRYGLELHPSGGKWDEESQSRRSDNPEEGVDKPDWRSGKFEAQASPDAVVHEQAHLEMMPEGIGLADGQRYMDQQYADVQRNHGYMKQKQSSGEVVPMSAENPIRRRAGLPPVHRDVPVKPGTPERRTVDTDEPAATRLQVGDKTVDQLASARLMRPEARERMDMIDRGEIRYNPETGWQPGEDVNSKINQRARDYSNDPTRKDAKTLMRSDKGVHKPFAGKDTSVMGHNVRGHYSVGDEPRMKEKARSEARKVLEEQRSMPKPNLTKAKIDSKLSEEGKAARRTSNRAPLGGNFSSKAGEKGVHLASTGVGAWKKRTEWGDVVPEEHQGSSDAGQLVRYHGAPAPQKTFLGFGSKVREPKHQHAVTAHKDKLAELRSMPKPNLPKSEEMQKTDNSIVKEKHLIFSMDNPAYGQHDNQRHQAMLELLKEHGADHHEIEGHYGKPERSIIVSNPEKHLQAAIEKILTDHGQESYIISDGYNHKMKFLNGENAGKHVRGQGTQFHETAPETGFSKTKDGEIFTHNFDFSQLHD